MGTFLTICLIYVVGGLITASVGLTILSVLNGEKVKSIEDLSILEPEIVFWVTVFWPIPVFLGLPIVILGGLTYGLFRLFQWIAFEIFKPKENT